MQPAAAGALGNLRLFVFGNHALELQQQLRFRTIPLASLEKPDFGPGAAKLFEQHHLVRVLTCQTIRAVAKHHGQIDLRGQVPQTLQCGALQRRPGIAVVLEHPVLGNL